MRDQLHAGIRRRTLCDHGTRWRRWSRRRSRSPPARGSSSAGSARRTARSPSPRCAPGSPPKPAAAAAAGTAACGGVRGTRLTSAMPPRNTSRPMPSQIASTNSAMQDSARTSPGVEHRAVGQARQRAGRQRRHGLVAASARPGSTPARRCSRCARSWSISTGSALTVCERSPPPSCSSTTWPRLRPGRDWSPRPARCSTIWSVPGRFQSSGSTCSPTAM